MKKTLTALLSVLLCFMTVFTFISCKEKSPEAYELRSGEYLMVCDSQKVETPHLQLNFDDYSFTFMSSLLSSHIEMGSFTVKDNELTLSSEKMNYVFEIKDSDTLILKSNGNDEFFKISEKSEFVYSDNTD